MKAVGFLLLGGIVTMSYWASQAHALPPFKTAFEKKYVADSTSDDFKAAFKKEGCNVCHVKGKEKTVRNDYGKALAKFTGGSVAKQLKAAKAGGGDAGQKAELDKVLKTLDDAFDKVEAEKSPSGMTYGDLIKAGKLPASK
jgi:cytochrome c551/c552